MGRSALRKKRRKRIIRLFTLLIALALFLATASFFLFFSDNFGLVSSLRSMFASSAVEEIDVGGLQIIDGDFVLDADGEKLQDAHVAGNLYLGPGIGEGSIDLINVKVNGSVLVQGGGLNSIFVRDCTFGEVKVNRPEGRVRLVFSGETVVDEIILETGSRLVDNISAEGFGIKSVQVVTDQQVEIAGEYEIINILVQNAEVEIDSPMIIQLAVSTNAGGTKIYYPDGMVINNMHIDGPVYLFGRGEIDTAFISAAGASELEGYFNRVRITAEAGYFDLIEGSSYQELTVVKGALNNVFYLYEGAAIKRLELNEAVTFKGSGEIEKVVINAPGTTMEQIPGDIEFQQEVSVLIAGHEVSSPEMLQALKEHGDPGNVTAAIPGPSAPEPAPAPAEAVEPDPAREEPSAETEPDRETGADEEELSEPPPSLPDFELEIVSPTAEDRDRLSLHGQNLIFITLLTDDPDQYHVELEGVEIRYLKEVKIFYGLVDEDIKESDLYSRVTIRSKE